MDKLRKYEVLSSLPPYGPMYIPISENGEPFYSEGLPIRFYRSDGTTWVANFEVGWTSLNQVIELLNTLLIIAGGLCYIMTPEETTPISVFGISYSTILKAENSVLILQNDVKLTIVAQDGKFWHTDRISFDGIKNLEVKDNLITGLSYDPTNSFQEWSKFTLDLNTKVLTGGSYRDYI